MNSLRFFFVLLLIVIAVVSCDREARVPEAPVREAGVTYPVLLSLQDRMRQILAADRGHRVTSVEGLVKEALASGPRGEISRRIFPLVVLDDLEKWRDAEAFSQTICLASIAEQRAPGSRSRGRAIWIRGVGITFNGDEVDLLEKGSDTAQNIGGLRGKVVEMDAGTFGSARYVTFVTSEVVVGGRENRK